MPLIEELPLTHARHAQPGWAYVPDTGAPNPIAAVQPGNRKRARNDPSQLSTTAKQQKAIDARLRDLEKENYKDVHVPIPKYEGGSGGGRRENKKMTANVRRILGYNRNFGHYLADEEAALAAGGGGIQALIGHVPPPTTTTATSAKPDSSGSGRRKSSGLAPTPTLTPRKQNSLKKETPDASADADAAADANTDTPMTDTDTTQHPPQPPYDPTLDTDPLLRTSPLYRPRPAPPDLLAHLLAEPPLSYTAARAQPLPASQQTPPRHFCPLCGHRAKVRCRRCGERTCGALECWRTHEAAGGCGVPS